MVATTIALSEKKKQTKEKGQENDILIKEGYKTKLLEVLTLTKVVSNPPWYFKTSKLLI